MGNIGNVVRTAVAVTVVALGACEAPRRHYEIFHPTLSHDTQLKQFRDCEQKIDNPSDWLKEQGDKLVNFFGQGAYYPTRPEKMLWCLQEEFDSDYKMERVK